MEKYPPIGANWDDVRKELFTPEEIEESNRRVAEIRKQIEKNKGREKSCLTTMKTQKKPLKR